MRSRIGALLALALLSIYGFLVALACLSVRCALARGCTAFPVAAFDDAMGQSLAELGGLVSALVIAELALTPPGDAPAARLLDARPADAAQRWLRRVALAYLAVWGLCGVCAYAVALWHPSVLPALTAVGQAWFGTALAAGYAYLGVRPSKEA